jgi:hypothetical protein
MMVKVGNIALLVLSILIVLSPLLWLAGVAWWKVGIADAFWMTIWMATAIVRRNYGD